MPEKLYHYSRDLLKDRQEWLSRINELTSAGILNEAEAESLKHEFLD
jgi:hypothetical protein